MNKNITVRCINTNEYKDYPTGISLLEVLVQNPLRTKYPIMVAKVNNKVEPLTYRIYSNKTIEFLTLDTSVAMRTYVRSLCFIMAKAVDHILPKVQFNIEHPLSKGYYCRLWTNEPITQNLVDTIKNQMREYIKADFPFIEYEMETERVVERFRKEGFF